jgi:hypothetical protein
MTKRRVDVTAAQERELLDVRLYILALIALARQLQEADEARRKEAARD